MTKSILNGGAVITQDESSPDQDYSIVQRVTAVLGMAMLLGMLAYLSAMLARAALAPHASPWSRVPLFLASAVVLSPTLW